MTVDVADFHFLRPLWLLALVPLGLILWALARRHDLERQWRGVIAPHLLTHLRVPARDRAWFRPLHLLALTGLLATVGAAGPTWEREPSPFAEDTAPLVIALDVSRTMNAVDVQPTRLERAKQKIRDLLSRRTGARTALVAYAGTAHTVLPLADDPSVFDVFLASLETRVMPVPGQDAAAALQIAATLLDRDEVPGSILFLTDHVDPAAVPAFATHQQTGRDAVMVLAVGTVAGGAVRGPDGQLETDAGGRPVRATLDPSGFEQLERETGAFVASVTPDDADVDRIERQVASHLQQVRQEDETARWRDAGYLLVYPVVLLTALWFRQGWTVRWSGWVLLVVVMPTAGCGSSSRVSDTWFLDLWLTPDQQGRRLYEREQYAEAAARFEDPAWRAAAFYRSGAYEQALSELARLDGPEAAFNTGNAYARLGRFEDAIAAYEAALAERADWAEAEENRALVASLIPEPEAAPPPGGEPTFDADQIEFDERGEQGERGEVDQAALTEEQLQEMWMRRLQTTPADFLRTRFAIEVALAEAETSSGSPEGGP